MATTNDTYQLNDVGSPIGVTIYRADGTVESLLGSATTKQIIIKKPSGELLTKTAILVTDGSDGKMKYVTASGDLDETGMYNYHGYVVIGSWQGRTTVKSFEVCTNLS